jgi:hypothetical protein
MFEEFAKQSEKGGLANGILTIIVYLLILSLGFFLPLFLMKVTFSLLYSEKNVKVYSLSKTGRVHYYFILLAILFQVCFIVFFAPIIEFCRFIITVYEDYTVQVIILLPILVFYIWKSIKLIRIEIDSVKSADS